MITDTAYAEFLESCTTFNKRISGERRHRMPFLDAQTGVAQNPSNLWRSKRERRPGPPSGSVVFYYPAKRFKKRNSSTVNLLLTDLKCLRAEDIASIMDTSNVNASMLNSGDSTNNDYLGINKPNSSSSLANFELKSQLSENTTKSEMSDKDVSLNKNAQQQQIWYDDLSDPAMDDDYNEPSDGDEYEEEASKSKPKKKSKKSPKGNRRVLEDWEKPHICPHCGAKYKTKPGLHYHLTHAHADQPPISMSQITQNPEQFSPSSRSSSASNFATMATTPIKHQPPAPGSGTTAVVEPPPPLSAASSSSRETQQSFNNPNVSQFCDFCLGDASENKKTNTAEELISCKDCGRSGHPTCLQFTANMIVSTKRHGWQCIECKSCAICGTSENDDQLLFCDDCDRGFHMYCLRPPLSAPPDGNWSCHLCTIEFGPNASNPAR